jgi:hypothetical protein
MKLLLDEHLPHLLRQEIPGHQVLTVAFMGWSGIENGELLNRAAAESFDALVTNDHGVEYEQNLASLPISIVYLNAKANTIEALRQAIPSLLKALTSLKRCQFVKLT